VAQSGTDPGIVFVCAHGAGGHKDDRGMLALDELLSGIGVQVVRFNFPYREAGSRRPDPMPVLKSTIAQVVSTARENGKKLLIGGRSMGGRAASMLAADGFECDGLMLFAYPLHPAGQPEKLRDAHLPKIQAPVLCFNGTRDALCTRELMDRAVKPPSWKMHWLEGADHSFHVLKSSGRTDREVLDEIGAVSAAWLREGPASPR
jgi:predicted alpha/beta-hydrolase family hydrolase